MCYRVVVIGTMACLLVFISIVPITKEIIILTVGKMQSYISRNSTIVRLIGNYSSKILREDVSQCQAICSQEQRTDTLEDVCRHHPEISANFDSFDAQMYNRILVDDEHQVLHCALPKVASTTFYNLYYFSVTGRRLDNIHCRECWEQEGLVWLSTLSKKERDWRLSDYLKVMVVRHPLDRLISCWNGKFTKTYDHATWKKHGPIMIDMYRDIPQNSSLEEEIKKGAMFGEFLRYIRHLENHSPDKHDYHWNSFHRLCHPCSIKYDMILKMESLDTNLDIILNRLDVGKDEMLSLNVRRSDKNGSLERGHILNEYRTVPPQLIEGLENLVRVDMEMFGYHWNHSALTASCSSPCTDGHGTCC